jgi:TPR repeat protein
VPASYRLAADQGDADAQYALAKSYRDGRGISRDDLQAYWLFSQVAASDDASHKDDAVKELYSLVQKFPAGTNLDPPLPPEPFGLKSADGSRLAHPSPGGVDHTGHNLGVRHPLD